MSALGGIYNFDSAPIDDALLAKFGRGLEVNAPDGGREFKSRMIGMAYRALHTNRESRLEAQPLQHPNGHILCWDGRLDNREDFIGQLREELRGDLTDVAIVMAAYLKWGGGISCPTLLVTLHSRSGTRN